MRTPRSWLLGAACLLALSVGWSAAQVRADLAPEPLNVVLELGPASPHWVLYHAFTSISASTFVLFDADTAEFKAHISVGMIPSLQQSPDGRELYVADTYLEGPERLRRDVLSIYSTRDYSLSSTIALPGNRRALMGPHPKTALIDGGRFLVLFNFTPSTGITVIDTSARSVVGDIATPGCSLVFPTGARGVSMICGDGRLLTLQLDSNGRLAKRISSEPFFDPDVDPVIENAAEIGSTWYFPSYSGDVYPVDLSGDEPVFHEPWPLVDHDKKPANSLTRFLSGGKAGPWLPGGAQLISAHAARGELFVLMHPAAWSEEKGDPDGNHVHPGAEVWVYDAAAKVRTRRLALQGVGGTVYVTADDRPLMLVSATDRDEANRRLEVYDAATGEYLRQMTGVSAFHFEGAPGSGGAR